MKFVGFEIPKKDWDDIEWVYDIIENKGNRDFYLVEAKNVDEARRKVFAEMYKNNDRVSQEMLATYGAWHTLEDTEESEVLKIYGEHDGKIIIDISGEYLDSDQENQDNAIPYDERINQLSENTVFELAYTYDAINVGIVKVKKTL